MATSSGATGTSRRTINAWRFVGHNHGIILVLVVALLTVAAYQAPRALRVNIGSEQDRGLTHGFNDRERNAGFNFRWSTDESAVLLPSLAGGTYTLTIGAAAPRPDGSAAHTDLLLDGRPFGVMIVGPAYQRSAFRIAIPSGIVGNHLLTLRTQTVSDTKNNARPIGVAVDDVALRAASWPLIPPLFPLLGIVADVVLAYQLLRRWMRVGAFLVTVVAAVMGLLYLLAFRHPLGPAVYQLFIPLAFLWGIMRCSIWALSRGRPPAWALGAVGALAFAALSAGDFLVRVSQVGKPTDFLIFYRAATAVWTGRPQEIYDLAAIKADPLLGVVFRQPPLAASLIAPLSALSFPTALLVWRALLVGFVAVSIWLLTRHFGLSRIGNPAGWPVVALTFLTLLWAPLRVSITSGQWDAVLLVLLSVAFIALRRKQSALAGFAIALAGIIKIYPLYLGLFLLWKREWRALGWLVASLLALTVVSGFTVGWDVARTYAQHVFPLIGGSTTFEQNQSLTALLLRLFGINATNGPTITGLSVACFLVVTAAVCVPLRMRGGRESASYALGYALTISAMLLIVPVAWDHYETVLLIPVAVLLATFVSFRPYTPTWLTIAVAALGLLTYGEARQLPNALTSQAFQYDDLTRTILASSRVFAQLGLMYVLWRLAQAPPRATVDDGDDTTMASPQVTDAAS